MALNILDVNIPPVEDNICIICHDQLDTAQTYKLPECNHTYHTHCIVTWFRHRGSCDYDAYGRKVEVDGKCPHCGNNGINNVCKSEPKSYGCVRRRCYLSPTEHARFKTIKREGKKHGESPILNKLFDKLDVMEKKLKDATLSDSLFKKKITTDAVNYSETKKIIRQNRNKVWEQRRNVGRIRKEIASFPIVPLIIPIPIDIN